MKFTIHGKCPSKSNSYKVITINGHGSIGKKPALKAYEKSFYLQVPAQFRGQNIDDLMDIQLHVYYPSNRSDLDNAAKIVLDCLQKAKVIKNDNKVVNLFLTKHLDKDDPRVEITVKKTFDNAEIFDL